MKTEHVSKDWTRPLGWACTGFAACALAFSPRGEDAFRVDAIVFGSILIGIGWALVLGLAGAIVTLGRKSPTRTQVPFLTLSRPLSVLFVMAILASIAFKALAIQLGTLGVLIYSACGFVAIALVSRGRGKPAWLTDGEG